MENTDRQQDFDCNGWLIKDKGTYYLATSRGWFWLTNVPNNSGSERSVRVVGRRTDSYTVEVERLYMGEGSDRESISRPRRIVDARTELHLASELRLSAQLWLARNGYTHVVLPHVWFRTEEYGESEFMLSHPAMSSSAPLWLLQSPELPMYLALSEGFEPSFTFGRCYRHDPTKDPDIESHFLLEFEQLVWGRSHSSLDEMMVSVEDFITFLAGEIDLKIDRDDFRRIDNRVERPDNCVGFEGLDFFSVPASWPRNALRLLVSRLQSVGANPLVFQGELLVPIEDLAESGAPTRDGDLRLAVPNPSNDPQIYRILDIATAMAGSDQSVPGIIAKQWNPTWSLYPELEWSVRERADSSLPVRSFTSLRTSRTGRTELVCDAELHLSGIEVAHVRAYADGPTIRKQAKAAAANADLHYLNNSAGESPTGIVIVSIGWERILTVLLGLTGPDRALLYPRHGRGELYDDALRTDTEILR